MLANNIGANVPEGLLRRGPGRGIARQSRSGIATERISHCNPIDFLVGLRYIVHSANRREIDGILVHVAAVRVGAHKILSVTHE